MSKRLIRYVALWLLDLGMFEACFYLADKWSPTRSLLVFGNVMGLLLCAIVLAAWLSFNREDML